MEPLASRHSPGGQDIRPGPTMSRFNNHGVALIPTLRLEAAPSPLPQQPTQLEPSSNQKIFHNMSHDGQTSIFNGSDYGGNAVLRVVRLPLVSSTLQSVTSVYSGVKGRFPLLGMVGGVAEVGLRAASLAALSQVTPLLQSLNPQIEAANDYACSVWTSWRKNFPVLQQSSEEVMGHLKDALLLTVDDVVGRAAELSELLRLQLGALQDSPLGRAAYSGLDEVLSQLEDASAYYLPLPPTMRLEWERRVQELRSRMRGRSRGCGRASGGCCCGSACSSTTGCRGRGTP
ncbi:unnamed protein product [Gadus morhua 'NCC']